MREAPPDVVGVCQLMGVLIAAGRNIEATQFFMHMVMAMIVFGECEVVVVGVIAVRQPHAGEEFMWLRDRLDRLDVVAAVREAEGLARAVRPFGLDGYRLGRPAMATL